MLFNDKIALIVDDSYTIRHQVKMLLKKLNISVVEAHDKNSMIKNLSINNKPVDLILMDLGLKKTTGFDLMAYLRSEELYENIPIIVLTGDATKRTVIAATKYKLAFYAIKPINPKDLSNKILTALENAERSKAKTINNSEELEAVLRDAENEVDTEEVLDTIHKTITFGKNK